MIHVLLLKYQFVKFLMINSFIYVTLSLVELISLGWRTIYEATHWVINKVG